MIAAEYAQECVEKQQIVPHFFAPSQRMNATIRRAKVSDAQQMQEMHQRLSQDSIYYRYLSPATPSLEHLQDICSIAEEEGIILVATVDEPGEKIVGIAFFLLDPQNPSAAEPAVLVEDAYQGCGLGKELLLCLSQDAGSMGVSEFNCHTHPANHRVLGMIQRSGMQFEAKYCDGMKEIRVWLNSNTA